MEHINSETNGRVRLATLTAARAMKGGVIASARAVIRDADLVISGEHPGTYSRMIRALLPFRWFSESAFRVSTISFAFWQIRS